MIRRSTLLKALGAFSLAGPTALKGVTPAAVAANQASLPRYIVVHGCPTLPEGEVLASLRALTWASQRTSNDSERLLSRGDHARDIKRSNASDSCRV